VGSGVTRPANLESAPAVVAVPARPAATGSGGGGAAAVAPPAPTADLEGRVLASLPDGEGGPIAEARVAAYGRGAAPDAEVLTDAEGRFRLAAVPTDRLIVVSAPGHAPSVVAGWDGGPLTLHVAASSVPTLASEVLVPVSGTVLTPEGTPAAGAIVVGGNGRGAAFGPLVADEAGRYAGMAVSFEGTRATDLAVWGFRQPAGGGVTALGLAEGVTIGQGAAGARVSIRPASGTWTLAPNAPSGALAATAVAVASNGMAVTLKAWEPGAALAPCGFFEVPGARLEARVVAESADGAARSVWNGPVAEPATVAPTLLPYPTVPTWTDATFAPGAELSWSPCAGAGAYRLSLLARDRGEPLWEGLAVAPRLTLHGLAAPGADAVRLTAMQGVAMRSVAALGPKRDLRWFDPDRAGGAYAYRTIPLRP
jgi:hypothetical protein